MNRMKMFEYVNEKGEKKNREVIITSESVKYITGIDVSTIDDDNVKKTIVNGLDLQAKHYRKFKKDNVLDNTIHNSDIDIAIKELKNVKDILKDVKSILKIDKLDEMMCEITDMINVLK